MTPWGVVVVSERQKNLKNNIVNQHDVGQDTLIKYLNSIGIKLEEVQTQPHARLVCNLKYLQRWADNYVYRPKTTKQKR